MASRTRLARIVALLIAAAAAGSPAAAQRIVTSPAPDSVDVTIYRDDGRGETEGFDRDWLGGYALVTETRRIRLPAGESEIRFEGVAAGLIPQSVIVTGLPEDSVERNRDALLLSPATLVDRSLGRRVHIRRRSLATGRVREAEAVIRTGADGAVVLQTREGFETLRCTGLPETLIYNRVPPGLSARPTLSVRARARREVSATVTLAYLAGGFDWQANYVVNLSAEGDRADFFAWLTLASNDDTSFPNADVQAVAGRVNREDAEAQEVEGPPLELRCWPHATTSDIPLEEFRRTPLSPRIPPPPPMAGVLGGESIVVTGSRMQQRDLTSFSPVMAITAEQEDLGTLKLYRIPIPVTVAANAQKQVALLQRAGVRTTLVHRQDVHSWRAGQLGPAERLLVTRNRAEEGLGLPLPAGPMLIFGERDGRPVLLGESRVGDRAAGEDVEIAMGTSSGVGGELRVPAGQRRELELIVTNDRSEPIRYEAEFAGENEVRADVPLERRDGRSVWAVTVPANGSATLRFRRGSNDD